MLFISPDISFGDINTYELWVGLEELGPAERPRSGSNLFPPVSFVIIVMWGYHMLEVSALNTGYAYFVLLVTTR